VTKIDNFEQIAISKAPALNADIEGEL